jgi:phage/plasmid-associated DNA primase
VNEANKHRSEAEAFAVELWGAWKRWCEETGEQAGSQKRFGGRLAERGFLNHRGSKTGRKVWSGLSLRPDWESRAGIPLNHSNMRFAGNSERTEPSELKNNNFPRIFLAKQPLAKKVQKVQKVQRGRCQGTSSLASRPLLSSCSASAI